MISFSIIIPVHNEAEIIDSQITKIISQLKNKYASFEIVLIENGSRDETLHKIDHLKQQFPHYISLDRIPEAHYGKALKKGILKAQYDNIIQCDLDFINLPFINRAITLLQTHDIVIGSKTLPKSQDRRPWYRKIFTFLFQKSIKLLFGYTGDTHGIKAYKKPIIEPLAKKIAPSIHLFDTELILRAFCKGYRITEVPIIIEELRPTRFEKRTRQALPELLSLFSKYHEITQRPSHR